LLGELDVAIRAGRESGSEMARRKWELKDGAIRGDLFQDEAVSVLLSIEALDSGPDVAIRAGDDRLHRPGDAGDGDLAVGRDLPDDFATKIISLTNGVGASCPTVLGDRNYQQTPARKR